MATHTAPAPPSPSLTDRIAGASDRGLSYLATCRTVLRPDLLAAVDAEVERRAAGENHAGVNGARRQEPREELPVGARPSDPPYVQRPGRPAVFRDETPAEWRPVAGMTTTQLIVLRDDARVPAERRAVAATELARRLAECSAAIGIGGGR